MIEIENHKKNDITKNKLKNCKGWIKNIKIISFPSLPPIIFKIYKRNESRKTIKKKKICLKSVSISNLEI